MKKILYVVGYQCSNSNTGTGAKNEKRQQSNQLYGMQVGKVGLEKKARVSAAVPVVGYRLQSSLL